MKKMQKVPWNKSLKVKNLLIIILVGISSVYIVAQCVDHRISWGILSMLIFVILLLLIGAVMLPLRIEMTDSELVLHKIVGKLSIPYDQIEIIASYNLNVAHSIPVYGYAGYTGLFRNEEVGRFKAYIGDYRETFFIRTRKGKNYVWSCINHKELIREVNEMRRISQRNK